MAPGQQHDNAIGVTVAPQCIAAVIDILKPLPWDEVYKVMPQLINAKPIIQEMPKKK